MMISNSKDELSSCDKSVECSDTETLPITPVGGSVFLRWRVPHAIVGIWHLYPYMRKYTGGLLSDKCFNYIPSSVKVLLQFMLLVSKSKTCLHGTHKSGENSFGPTDIWSFKDEISQFDSGWYAAFSAHCLQMSSSSCNSFISSFLFFVWTGRK